MYSTLSVFEKIKKGFMKITSKHFELFKAECMKRFVMEHEINEAEHGLIRVLQSVLYPKY